MQYYRSTTRRHWQAAERATADMPKATTAERAQMLRDRLAQLRGQAETK